MSRAQRKAAKRRRDASRAEFRWREGERRISQNQRDHQRDAQDANKEAHRAGEKIAAIQAKAIAEVRRQTEAIERRYAAEEKALCTRAVTSYTGATRFNAGPILVTHWRLRLPDALADRLGVTRQAEGGPLAVLPPGGGKVVSAVDVFAQADTGLGGLDEFMQWAAKSAKPWRDEINARYHRLLINLRNDAWWAQVCERAGLVQKVSAEEAITGAFGTYTRTRAVLRVPSLTRVHIGRTGLRLMYRHVAGDSVKSWQGKADAIRAALKSAGAPADGLIITEDHAGNILAYLNDLDPFGEQPQSGTFDTEQMRSLLGVTASGEEAWIRWAGSSGMVVGGVPGSGKTASLLPLFAGMAGKADLYVFDGKSGYDLHPLRHIARVYDRSGDLDAPLETLRLMELERVRRAEMMYRELAANNFWNIPDRERQKAGLRPKFVILDEVQTWLDTSGMDREEKAVAGEITKLIRTLIQKGRSAGIVTILTTQKPDAQSIPTVIRDNAALKICFRVSTPEQAITVLGRQATDAPDPTDIPMSARGRCVMETEGHGVVLIQAGYTPPEALERHLGGGTPDEPDPDGPGGPGGEPDVPQAEQVAPAPAVTAPPAEDDASTSVSEELAGSPALAACAGLAVTLPLADAAAALTAAASGTSLSSGLPPAAEALRALAEQVPPAEIGWLIGELHKVPLEDQQPVEAPPVSPRPRLSVVRDPKPEPVEPVEPDEPAAPAAPAPAHPAGIDLSALRHPEGRHA